MDNTTLPDPNALTKRGYLTLALVVVATAITWLAWLGWDTKRTTDPVTQNTTGPYEPWQVIGCGLTLLVIAVFAAMRLPIWPMVVAITATFTIVWSVSAVATDDSGLWAVGALMVGGGVFLGALTVHGIVDSLTRRRHPRPSEPLRR